jgi:hypothetical protein
VRLFHQQDKRQNLPVNVCFTPVGGENCAHTFTILGFLLHSVLPIRLPEDRSSSNCSRCCGCPWQSLISHIHDDPAKGARREETKNCSSLRYLQASKTESK